MKKLSDFKEKIHKCSKCGICQSTCPIYKITGNDCAVSKGLFIMLSGVLNGKLKLTKEINRYLDLCLKCNACSKICPSSIEVADIIIAAKSKYFQKHIMPKIHSGTQKIALFILQSLKHIRPKYKSQSHERKVLYFGGCGELFSGDKAVKKVLNALDIEVITPNFDCCGVGFWANGDLKQLNRQIDNFIKIVQTLNIYEIVTTCASCENTINNYIKWADTEDKKEILSKIKINSIYKYISNNKLQLTLKEPTEVSYHKPCSSKDYEDILWILNNTRNLKYKEMQSYDSCCGLNTFLNIQNFKITSKLIKSKQNSIVKSKIKNVLTSCFGCEIMLKLYSFGRYKVFDLLNFLERHL